MPYRLRDGSATEDRRLDRLVSFDERSRAFPVRAVLPDRKPRAYTWRSVTTDQGREGACTGHAVTQEAAARPVPAFGDPLKAPPDVARLNTVAYSAYRRAQQLDPWPGEEPAYSGSSVLAAVKAGQEQGWWTEYRWALGPGADAAANDVILSVGYRGPVIMGTYWYEGMYRPDPNGALNVAGSIVGGHAYLLTSYSIKRDAVFTPNSWGGAGAGWISRADLTRLLAEDGEACVPTVRRHPVPAR